jgi:hypothetical protein
MVPTTAYILHAATNKAKCRHTHVQHATQPAEKVCLAVVAAAFCRPDWESATRRRVLVQGYWCPHLCLSLYHRQLCRPRAGPPLGTRGEAALPEDLWTLRTALALMLRRRTHAMAIVPEAAIPKVPSLDCSTEELETGN